MSSMPWPAQPPARAGAGDGAFAVISRLLTEYGRVHWVGYAGAMVLMALAAGCTALSAYLVGNVVNEAYIYRNLPGIFFLGFVTVVLFTIKGLTTYGSAVILSRIGNRIVAQNQRRLFQRLLQQDLSFFAGRHSSEFAARVSACASSASNVLNMVIMALGRDILVLIGLASVMIIQDPVMSLAGIIIMPPAIFALRKLMKRVKNVANMQFTGGTKILETLQETLQGIRIVKSFELEDAMRARFNESVVSVERASNTLARVSNRASPLMESLGGIAIALAFVYGGYRVIGTNASPGEFFSFVTAFLLAYEPAKRLARLNLDLQSNLVGVRLMYETIDAPATEPDDNDKPALQVTAASVRFDDVEFGYREGEPVLTGMSFVAEGGKVTALVGSSGGGKSTVLNLILRFYEPQAGVIAIDGQNIATVSRSSLRGKIAYVGQDVFLFRGTIRENIAFGKAAATEAEIIDAAKAALAHEFIMTFPQGYDTPVGELGLSLSGGQRQRVAIARALLKDAPIILLDEATAALDSESERKVQLAIEHLSEGRTTIVIAHRLHTIARADCIHVVEQGRVIESGRHEELLSRGGRYAAFYRLQLKTSREEHAETALSA
jgi:ATP-binding cassette, subfamily B, bacterial MsbA